MLPTPACRCLRTAVRRRRRGWRSPGCPDLIEPVIDELAGGLAPPRRAALEIALLRADAGDVPPDSRAIGLAVRDALVLLARSRPVVLALDDIQWLDRSSADVLATALRRLLREPVRLLATLRSAPDLTPALDLRRAFDDERLRLATLEPLELGQLHRLLSARLGLELARPELQELRRISAAIRTSRWSSPVSADGSVSPMPRTSRCAFPATWESCLAIGSRGYRRRSCRFCWQPRRFPSRRSR